MAAQVKSLKMHNKLLLDVIKRQAGTLEKAILEGVMNGIEAGASRVDIEFAENDGSAILAIKDDGKGISSETEIEKFFETFGTPHDESENKVWAQFRMGRGQLFAFGKNTWNTSTFKMEVDIDNWGLDYHLTKDLQHRNGCDILVELYQNPIGRSYNSVEALKDRVMAQIRYMSVPVFFNGEQINVDPSTLKWTEEDKYAYYNFDGGTNLTYYNLGAYVMTRSASDAGTVGIIVSKQQLKVNFARNDIQHDCDVRHHIEEVVKKYKIKKVRNTRRTLHDYERQNCLSDLRDEYQDYDDVKTLSILRTAQGRHITLETMKRNRQQWTFAPMGDRFADKLIEQGQAVCLDSTMLDELGYTGDEQDFFDWLVAENRYSKGWDNQPMLYVQFDDLKENVKDEYQTIPQNRLTTVEKRYLRILNGMNCWDGRVINIGMSDNASAWTDGSSYITIERNFLKANRGTYASAVMKLFSVLVHELAHDEDTRETHVHGVEFYRNYHDLVTDGYGVMQHAIYFKDKLVKGRMDEAIWKQQAKEEKANKKLHDSLGTIAASSK
tara:strand:+ start:18310 stop:19965 length:1656 start_codon:yes stop_codon:yes gene_type:complete